MAARDARSSCRAHGFAIYQIAGTYAGSRVIKVPERNLTADVDAMLAAVSPATRLVFLANPNNPTGSMLPQTEVARLRAGLPPEVLLVLDAAYAEYVDAAGLRPGHQAGGRRRQHGDDADILARSSVWAACGSAGATRRRRWSMC